MAVEDKGTHLKLTSQTEAGWYRYIPVYEFYADGTIQTRMDATAVTHSCVQYTHNHHAYWRMDFDLAGAAGDFIDDLTAPPGSQRIGTEQNFIDTSPARRRWRVGSAGTAYTVEVTRNAADQGAGDPPLVTGDFPIADGWALAFASNELSDQSVPHPFGCGAGMNAFDNNQNIDNADVVLWVRGAGYHQGELGMPTPTGCEMFGPTIRVVEGSPASAQFHTVAPCRILDTRSPAGPYGAPALAPGVDRTFVVGGQCTVPANAKAVFANLTVTQPGSLGHLQMGAGGEPVPSPSVISFGPGQTRANNATIRLGPGGEIAVRTVMESGTVHLVLDVTGYYQ